MIQIDREMPTCCEDCFAQQEYYNPRWDETEYSCGVNGENLGTHSRQDRGEWHCDRPKWCPLKEQEAETGHWIIVEYETLTCSCCGKSYYTGCDSTKEAIANLEKGNVYCYCPYCGSKMKGR